MDQTFNVDDYDLVEEKLYPALFARLEQLESSKRLYCVMVSNRENDVSLFGQLSSSRKVCVLAGSTKVARVMLALVRLHIEGRSKHFCLLFDHRNKQIKKHFADNDLFGKTSFTIDEVIKYVGCHEEDFETLAPEGCSLNNMDVWTVTRLRVELEAAEYKDILV